ncbi:50S ribosomal protein L29 [Patescibacteria group bacterium]|nr:50S ribosomal protein L29 [Patescibacteria group bacterium]MBU1246359.1 50S ribosomal protein L29 [Patescibacteria group bacterium]MBU1519079.1 50S ribosomal protein L29 [Patescibacteria group bacterium]MBU1730147.1 50S ribosomal protein L29 [Patescibacteria group bacterium]MBU1956410.1 50S ribosomal protein L29 [Patescibacteria group bacterium]
MSSDLTKKTERELYKMLTDKREDLYNSRFKTKGTTKKNVKEISNIKKNIAQVLTELRRREISE